MLNVEQQIGKRGVIVVDVLQSSRGDGSGEQEGY